MRKVRGAREVKWDEEGKGSKGSKMGWRKGRGARDVKWDGGGEGEQGK